MNKTTSLITGIGIGALAMYLFDPDRGNRRRALIRDKAVSVANAKREAMNVMARDLANRTKGLTHDVKARFEKEDPADTVLSERIRAAMGRVVMHPSSIQVSCESGTATLRGPVLANEVEDLLDCVQRVRGVHRVVNELEVHTSPEGVPGLQGYADVRRMQGRWTPAESLLMGALGFALAAFGMVRRTPAGMAASTLGTGMLVKSFRDTEMRFMPGGNDGRSNGQAQGQSTSREAGRVETSNTSGTVREERVPQAAGGRRRNNATMK